ncbi:terpenoid cyclases/Protein prenyltransferase [Violaceomyces palustris]|uniref:Terpenoid cyclases/Protein prenyltransferase n=1 Tax=Violaceomyces palustris TaxID=1673888 RepID=A0ACD0NL71_9BASI|nr:terpenoid cyclases/Protein prenyltransferase [Violaceomyces palustris]
MTLAFFCLAGLDLLGLVEQRLTPDERSEFSDWIYDQQIPSSQGGGFRGSPAGGDLPSASKEPAAFDTANLAMTYTALLNLAILRDDFSRLDRQGVLAHVKSLQQPDGSFASAKGQQEYDARFVYCAFAICYMLDDWSPIDVDAALEFLSRSKSYDGAFGQAPTQESQGGSTYCALSALSLSGRLSHLTLEERHAASKWLLSRQIPGSGFNGRIDKPVDTCYSFWCGASAWVLSSHANLDHLSDMVHLLSNQSPIGGISKALGEPPDVMHSYLSMAALSIHAHSIPPERDPSGTKPIDRGCTPVAEEEGSRQREERMRQKLKGYLREIQPDLNLTLESKSHLVAKLWRR